MFLDWDPYFSGSGLPFWRALFFRGFPKGFLRDKILSSQKIIKKGGNTTRGKAGPAPPLPN